MTSSPGPLRLRFAMDHCFPKDVIRALNGPLESLNASLEPIPPSHQEAEDWALVLEVKRLEFDALVTTDGNFLDEARVLPCIIACGLHVVSIGSANQNSIRATGAFLMNLPTIVRAIRQATKPLVFRANHTLVVGDSPDGLLRERAGRTRERPEALMESEKPTPEELRSPPASSE